jgi:hypothetical protein
MGKHNKQILILCYIIFGAVFCILFSDFVKGIQRSADITSYPAIALKIFRSPYGNLVVILFSLIYLIVGLFIQIKYGNVNNLKDYFKQFRNKNRIN